MSLAPSTPETAYSLTGSAVGPFATVWPYEAADDVKVYLTTAAGLTLLEAGPDYTLTGLSPLTDGGSVTLDDTLPPVGGWAAGDHLALQRVTGADQPSGFGEVEGFSPAASEAALDHVARQAQEAAAALARAVRAPPGETFDPLPSRADRAGKLAVFTDDGDGVRADRTLAAFDDALARAEALPDLSDARDEAVAAAAEADEARNQSRAYSMFVTPAQYGDLGGGATSDLAAITAAMNAAVAQNKWLDGQGLLYGLDGKHPWHMADDGLRCGGFRIVDINPNQVDSCPVRSKGNGQGKLICEEFVVNRNGDGAHGAVNGGFGFEIGSGVPPVSGYRRLILRNIEVFGNNAGGGIRIYYSSGIAEDLYVHDVRFVHAAQTDDTVEGISIAYCNDLQVDRPVVRGMGYTDQTTVYRDNLSRGMGITGCKGVQIFEPQGSNLAQWIDITGTPGNIDVSVIGGYGENILSNGGKIANSGINCWFDGTVVERCGGRAFVISPPAVPGPNPSRDSGFRNCLARNTGVQQVDASPTGFLAIGGISGDYAQYPKNLHIRDCMSICDMGSSPFTADGSDTLTLSGPITLTPAVRCRLSTTGATDYWMIPILGANAVKLANSVVNALDGVGIASFAAGAGTLTLFQDKAYGARLTSFGSFDSAARPHLDNFKSVGHLVAHDDGFPAPMAQVSRAAALSVASGTGWTDIGPDTITSDQLGMAATTPWFVATEPGPYLFSVNALAAVNATGSRRLRFMIDQGAGAVDVGILDARPANASPDATPVSLSKVFRLKTGDKVKAQVGQSSGGALNFTVLDFTWCRVANYGVGL